MTTSVPLRQTKPKKTQTKQSSFARGVPAINSSNDDPAARPRIGRAHHFAGEHKARPYVQRAE